MCKDTCKKGTFRAMKFDVTGKPELNKAVQARLIEIGYHPSPFTVDGIPDRPDYLYAHAKGALTYSFSNHGGERFFYTHPFKLATLSDLYDVKPPEPPTVSVCISAWTANGSSDDHYFQNVPEASLKSLIKQLEIATAKEK